MIQKILASMFVSAALCASAGCGGGSPCEDLKKVDCSKAADQHECEAWKQQGLQDGSKDGCQASLDTKSVKSAMGK
jgi:hypothetical protein